jgi:7,8-dihydropterin-6-yl-methyl-4-(beta-D-ribofuranosyl)aminobenzene 5'-phosphate synthase
VLVSARQELLPGAWTTGEVPGNPPEQALVIATVDGPVVVTGCAHPGVVNICRVAKDQFGAAPALVVGGFHLREPGPEQGRAVSEELKELGVARVGPSHCTGADAQAAFAEQWGEQCERVGCGWTGEWEAR